MSQVNDLDQPGITEQVAHCISKIREIIQSQKQDRRSLLQLGYNLGRLSELTGLGREPFWDSWKEPVSDWDHENLTELCQQLEKHLQEIIRPSEEWDSHGFH